MNKQVEMKMELDLDAALEQVAKSLRPSALKSDYESNTSASNCTGTACQASQTRTCTCVGGSC